jgi:hypothetical protein
MPSIFIWKAEEPNTSKKQVRYYSGSNWTLEDNDFSSKSYMFLDQIVIPGFTDSVITYRAKQMPQDWVGTELLEVSCIPFEQIKSDNYGTLDKIGNWMRFISKNEIEFESESLQKELTNIKKWMTEKKSYTNSYQKHLHHTTPPKILSQNVQDQFQEFLIKYNVPIPGKTIAVSSTNNLILDTINSGQSNSKNIANRNNYKKNNSKAHLNKNKFVLK